MIDSPPMLDSGAELVSEPLNLSVKVAWKLLVYTEGAPPVVRVVNPSPKMAFDCSDGLVDPSVYTTALRTFSLPVDRSAEAKPVTESHDPDWA